MAVIPSSSHERVVDEPFPVQARRELQALFRFIQKVELMSFFSSFRVCVGLALAGVLALGSIFCNEASAAPSAAIDANSHRVVD